MNFRITGLLVAALLIHFGGAIASGQPAQPPTGFEVLFNGENLDGWYAIKTQDPREFAALPEDQQQAAIEAAKKSTGEHWRVEEGQIVNDGQGPYLTTERHFSDFELMIDYKTVARADSGIYLKATPQVQIWDYTDEAKFKIGSDKGSGGLWNNKHAHGKNPLVLADKPFGEWNRFRIRQVGSRTSVWLNDKLVVDHAVMDNYWGQNALPLAASGPIQLQTHGGEIRWRNIFVREIDSEEANQILASKNSDGFKSVFDGSTLEGWSGAVDNYQVVDGAILCKQGKGGNLFTAEQYGDFVARLEFKLPAGGNNGLAIRYPGEGNPAYQGMCELQVLDSEHPKYAKLDDRQYHGSAYGMAAAHRGYLRPTGEWNFQEVTVEGSEITVELNGTIILQTDLSKIDSYMADSPHPGKTLKQGHFGFAGHNDPVAFRNIQIKSLDE